MALASTTLCRRSQAAAALLRCSSRRASTTTTATSTRTTLSLYRHAYRPSSSSYFFSSRYRCLCSSTTTTHSTSPPSPFDWPTLLEEKKTWAEPANGEDMLIQDLRSDHAGETGAVYIYKGALAAMSMSSPSRYSSEVRLFVETHHATEAEHLAHFDRLLDKTMKSKLLLLWRVSGWSLGFFPTFLFGEKALFVTVEAVESFVELHYQEQIYPLQSRGVYPELVSLLKHCCEEEVHHKEDAKARWLGDTEQRPWYATLWAQVVEKGSQGAVAVCKRI